MKFLMPSFLVVGLVVSGCSPGNQGELESLRQEEESFRNRATIALEAKARMAGKMDGLRRELVESPAGTLEPEVIAAEKRVRELEAELAGHKEMLAAAEKCINLAEGRAR